MGSKALFLDRDGVINIDHGYVSRINDFEFVDGIFHLMKTALEKGYIIIIVTNQSGIGRGYYSEEDFEKLTAWMLEQLKKEEISIDRSHIFFCPHDPDEGCECRKPMPGMFLEAAEKFEIDMPNSWMIGDKKSDIEAAVNAGVGHVFLTEKNKRINMEDLHGF